jgi:hypothetical protein
VRKKSSVDLRLPPPLPEGLLLAHLIRAGVCHALATTTEADGATCEQEQDERDECEPEACVKGNGYVSLMLLPKQKRHKVGQN